MSELVDYRNREAWLAARVHGVGASESAALFGLSPYDSQYSLWAKKLGLLPQTEITGEWVEWGNLLEPTIAERYAKVTGRTIWHGGPFAVAQHPKIPFMFSTPDRFVIDAPDRDGEGLLQVKNTHAFTGHNWNEGPPDYIQIQVQHEMAVTGRDWASVAVLIGGNRFQFCDIERNEVFIEELEEQCRLFWGLVERKEQPPIDGHPSTIETIKRLHPADNGKEIVLPEDALTWWARLQGAKGAIKEAEATKEEYEAKLKAAIGDATWGLLPSGELLSLKTTSRAACVREVSAGSYRTLRLDKKGKKR